MADIDNINGIILSLAKKEYSFKDLTYLSAPFHISETNLRSALSRMVQRGFYRVRKEGKNAFYSLSDKGKRIGKNLSRGFKQPDWSSWKGDWLGAFFSLPEQRKAERRPLRNKLQGYRFARWYRGCWIRPNDNSKPFDGRVPEELRLICFTPHRPIGQEEVIELWDLKNTIEEQRKGLLSLDSSLSHLTPDKAFFKRIEQGNRLVPLIFKDPLLPPELLPNNWVGEELRNRFLETDRILEELSRPYWEKIFSGGEL